MRLIGHLNAAVACRERIEEYLPERGVVPADVTNVVRAAFSFQVFPQHGPGQIISSNVFQGGKYVGEDGESFAVAMLTMEQNGDVVITTTTDQADLVIDRLFHHLDSELGYRLGAAPLKRSYVSNVVVEFDIDIEGRLGKLADLLAIVNSGRPGMPGFGLKRLALGLPEFHAAPDQVSTVEAADFLIERRAGAETEENRYYCSAPMRTQDHIRVLNEIEALLRGPSN